MGAHKKMIEELIQVYSIGLVGGIFISAIPFMLGCVVNLPLDIMRKG